MAYITNSVKIGEETFPGTIVNAGEHLNGNFYVEYSFFSFASMRDEIYSTENDKEEIGTKTFFEYKDTFFPVIGKENNIFSLEEKLSKIGLSATSLEEFNENMMMDSPYMRGVYYSSLNKLQVSDVRRGGIEPQNHFLQESLQHYISVVPIEEITLNYVNNPQTRNLVNDIFSSNKDTTSFLLEEKNRNSESMKRYEESPLLKALVELGYQDIIFNIKNGFMGSSVDFSIIGYPSQFPQFQFSKGLRRIS